MGPVEMIHCVVLGLSHKCIAEFVKYTVRAPDDVRREPSTGLLVSKARLGRDWCVESLHNYKVVTLDMEPERRAGMKMVF